MVRALGRGILWGLAWGVAARGFMRLFSDEPEFSWTGTGFIVGLSLLLFTGLSLVREARLSGRSRWWRVAPVPGLLLLAGPGLLLGPALLGGLVAGLAGRVWVRGAIVVLGAAATFGLLLFLVTRDPTASVWTPRGIAGAFVYVVCALALGLASAEWTLRRRPSTASTGDPARELVGS